MKSSIADAVTSHFYDLKYNGVMAGHYKAAKPEGNCAASEQQRKQSLSIQDLAGIWVAAYIFAALGIVAKGVQGVRGSYSQEEKVKWVDQVRTTWNTKRNCDITLHSGS